MKTKLMKIKLFFVSLSLIVMSSVMVSASPYGDQHTHIDHADSENCIYSCEHSINHYKSDDMWGEEKADDFIREFNAADSDAEAAAVISRYYGIPYTEEDFKEMLIWARQSSVAIDSNFICALKEASTVAEEAALFSEYCGHPMTAEDLEALRSAGSGSETETRSLNDSSCEHDYLVAGCEGDHYGFDSSDCSVWCRTTATCMYRCGSTTNVTRQHSEHSWSEGWCGRTCTVCGTVEKFHEPGGCWYCS